MRETRRFIRQYMKMIGFEGVFKDDIFVEIFSEMDQDATGHITQDDLKDYLRNLLKTNS